MYVYAYGGLGIRKLTTFNKGTRKMALAFQGGGDLTLGKGYSC